MSETKKEEVVKKAIPTSHLVVLVILSWLVFAWAYVTRVMSGAKYWTVTGAWLPWIYILFIVAYLGKKMNIKIDKTLLVAIIFIFGIVTSKWYYFTGTSEVDFINNISSTLSASLAIGVYPPEASYLKGLLPSWLVCFDPIASARYFNGGGEPIWSAYIGPIISWSLIFISIALMSLSLTFLFLGPEFYETEHLPFPMTVPTRYVVNNVYTEDPNKFGDLFFNIRQHKIFWVGALIGLILNIPTVLSQIVPAIPLGSFIGGGYGIINLDQLFPAISSTIRSIFPNAQNTGAMFNIPGILLYMLVPYEIITTGLFWWFLLYLFYPGLVTRAGILAPGASVWTSWPIPLTFFSNSATMLGLGLVVLFITKSKIKRAFLSFKEDYEINGMSARTILSLGIVGVILFIMIWVVAGADPIFVTLFWLISTLEVVGGAYFYAQLLWYGADCVGGGVWTYAWPISAGLGLLPTIAPTPSVNAAVTGYMTVTLGTCVGPFESNGQYNPSILSAIYHIGADTKADLRRLFLYLLTVMVFLAPFAFVFDSWFNSHVGISNTSQSSMDMFWWGETSGALNTGVQTTSWLSGPLPVSTVAVGRLAVAIFMVICYIIISRFPMLSYVLHPIGIAQYAGWVSWFGMLIALVAKYILNRAVGPRRAMEVTIELVAGLAVGFGLLYLVLGGYVFFTISLPNLGLLWK